jgi:Tfp pilus assembly protein PilE
VDSALIGVLANLGTGGVVIVLLVLGYLVPKPTHTRVLEESARKDAAIDKLEQALALERQRSDATAQAGEVTNKLIGGLVQLATEHRAAEKHEHRDHQDAADAAEARTAAALDLTAKDLGL